MALILETGLRNVLADAVDTEVGTAGFLQFETSGDVEVATIPFGNPAFGAAATGVITLNGTPIQDTSATGGTTSQFSIYKSGPTKLLEGTVATSGADINISSTVIGAGDTVELTSFTITMPAT